MTEPGFILLHSNLEMVNGICLESVLSYHAKCVDLQLNKKCHIKLYFDSMKQRNKRKETIFFEKKMKLLLH